MLNKKIDSKAFLDKKDTSENSKISFKEIRVIAIKTIICLIALFILIIFMTIKPAVNNFLTSAYLWLSIIATSFLAILLPKVLITDLSNLNNLYNEDKPNEKNILFDKKKRSIALAYELSDFFSIFIVSCVIIQGFFAFGYFRAEVNGNSMFPTLVNNESLLVESTNNINNFDIIVLCYDESINMDTNLADLQDGEKLIKRLIGKGGDSLMIINGKLLLNGNYIEEEYVDERWQADINLEDYLGHGVIFDRNTNKYIIEEGYYFVLGDNRLSSIDSEELGLFKKEQIIGKAVYKIKSIFDWEKLS